MKRFGASIEWLTEQIGMTDEEIEWIRESNEMEEKEKGRAKRLKGIADVLEEVGILIDTHHFNAFLEIKAHFS